MSDFQKSGRTDSPSPADSPLGSPASRATARALAEARFLPVPDLITVCIEPLLDPEGKDVWGGRRCDSVRASVGYRGETTYYDRNPGETLEDFERRVLATHPCGRFPRALTLIPTKTAAK